LYHINSITKTMNQTRVQKLEQRILTLEKILQKFILETKDEKAMRDLLSETKKEYKMQMYQD